MQLNPIIVREFRARWRGWRAFAIVLGYTALLALSVGLLYAGNVRQSDFNGIPARRMAQIGHDLFFGLTAMQVFAWMLLAPALTATSIAGEREEGMLDLLQMSPLSPWSIVWGKLLAALTFIFLMMLAPLPIVALCFLMGGVSPGEFYVAVALQGASAVTGAVIGLFCSAWCRRASTALGIAFTIVGGWGLSSAFAALFEGSMGSAGQSWLKEFAYLLSEVWWRTNPVVAVFASTSFTSKTITFYAYDIPNWAFTVVFEVVIAIVLLYYATRAMRKPLQEPLDKQAQPQSGLTTCEPLRDESAARSAPQPRQSVWWEVSLSRRITFANPVLQRELQRKLRIRKPSSKISALLIGLGTIGVLLYLWGLIYGITSVRDERQMLFWLSTVCYLLVVTVVAASMSATAFPRERESHSWESLRLSRLTPAQIIVGKLVPALLACWVLTLGAFTLLMPAITSWSTPASRNWDHQGVAVTEWLSAMLIVGVMIWSCACGALLVSWWCKRSWVAVMVSISSLVFLFIFIPIFLSLYTPNSDDLLFGFLRLWHPLFAMIEVLDRHWNGRTLMLFEIVIPIIIVHLCSGLVFLWLLYREMQQSTRELVPWGVKMAP